jgi:hypothetical protein
MGARMIPYRHDSEITTNVGAAFLSDSQIVRVSHHVPVASREVRTTDPAKLRKLGREGYEGNKEDTTGCFWRIDGYGVPVGQSKMG